MGYNETNKGHHKYTINLPTELYESARKKAEAVGIYSVSIYFRAILIREIKNQLSADEIINGRRESEITDRGKHLDRKLENIENIHKRNIFVNIIDKVLKRSKMNFN